MQGKEVGTIKVSKGSRRNGSSTDDMYLVSLEDSKHVHMMLNNQSVTIRNGKTKIRVGSESAQFKHGEVKNHYYYGMHALYDDKNNRQGYLSFEEEFISNDWNLKQFGCVTSTC